MQHFFICLLFFSIVFPWPKLFLPWSVQRCIWDFTNTVGELFQVFCKLYLILLSIVLYRHDIAYSCWFRSTIISHFLLIYFYLTYCLLCCIIVADYSCLCVEPCTWSCKIASYCFKMISSAKSRSFWILIMFSNVHAVQSICDILSNSKIRVFWEKQSQDFSVSQCVLGRTLSLEWEISVSYGRKQYLFLSFLEAGQDIGFLHWITKWRWMSA